MGDRAVVEQGLSPRALLKRVKEGLRWGRSKEKVKEPEEVSEKATPIRVEADEKIQKGAVENQKDTAEALGEVRAELKELEEAAQPRSEAEMIAEIPLPTTGMHIPKNLSEIRSKLTKHLDDAVRAVKFKNDSALARQHFDEMGETPGISIIEAKNFEQKDMDNFYSCAEYALVERNGENWLGDNGEIVKDFWTDNYRFLTKHGYSTVETPDVGDLAAYGYYDASNPDRVHAGFEHFGIYEGEGQVTSRFDVAHVYRHPWAVVPSHYGEQIVFFRKPTVPSNPTGTVNK